MAAIEQVGDLLPTTAATPLRRALGIGGTLIAWYLLQTLVSVITLAILGRLGDAALAGMTPGCRRLPRAWLALVRARSSAV